jgi:O-acetyl-ADP-ribose deacetylase (regulator of RNase III)
MNSIDSTNSIHTDEITEYSESSDYTESNEPTKPMEPIESFFKSTYTNDTYGTNTINLTRFHIFNPNESFISEAQRLEKYGIRVLKMNLREILINYEMTALISPANSLGIMNGGIDEIYMKIFPGIENKVQEHIDKLDCKTNKGRCYLPIGSSTSVLTDNSFCPVLICTPTMFFPMNIQGSKNIFAAFMSILHIVSHNPNSTIMCPGLGTGVGQMSAKESIDQIEMAINKFESFTQNKWYQEMIKWKNNNNIIMKENLVGSTIVKIGENGKKIEW